MKNIFHLVAFPQVPSFHWEQGPSDYIGKVQQASAVPVGPLPEGPLPIETQVVLVAVTFAWVVKISIGIRPDLILPQRLAVW
jgi:hypothetical protein